MTATAKSAEHNHPDNHLCTPACYAYQPRSLGEILGATDTATETETATVRDYALKIMDAIESDYANGTLYQCVSSFTELHDQVDANDYLQHANVPWLEGTDTPESYGNQVLDLVDLMLNMRAAGLDYRARNVMRPQDDFFYATVIRLHIDGGSYIYENWPGDIRYSDFESTIALASRILLSDPAATTVHVMHADRIWHQEKR